jgi:anaerobic selenocysteine-containing dehydrogenase
MSHVIWRAGEYDRDFIRSFVNVSPNELDHFLAPCTPSWAEQVSGVPASDIQRIALEFAARRPAVVAFTNRGTGAHYNGLNAERAVVMLNALAGSIGTPGGYCYGIGEGIDEKRFPRQALAHLHRNAVPIWRTHRNGLWRTDGKR